LQHNAALKAKLAFIEEKYDFSSQAKNLNVQDFTEIKSTNEDINGTMLSFVSKLKEVQA
jgi:hypothetical protein